VVGVSDMRQWSLFRTSSVWRVGLIVLCVIAAFAAGTSGLVYPSLYSPLTVGAFIAAVVTLVAWFLKPIWALYAALFVVLLPIGLIPPEIHSNLNRSMTVIALGVWLFDVVTWRRRVVWTSTALLMLGFVTWGIVTLFWTADLSVGMTILQTYTLRLILYLVLVANEIRTKENLDGLMNTLALNGWVLVLVGAGTVLLEGYRPGTRLRVFDVNENALGISALVTMPGVLWQAMRTSGRQKAVRMLLGFIFISLALVLAALTGSRGSAISLFITLLAFWLWKPTRPWGKLGLLILALAAITAPFIFSTTLERFAVTQGDTLLGGREALWQAVWPLILDHIWRGVGIGNAPYAVMPYLGMLGSVWAYERAVIHNPALTIWAETGIPGILLYLGVLGSAVWLFARQYHRHKKAGVHCLMPYFALVSSLFLGYMPSWIKGGGIESDFTYFLILALLVVPSHLDVAGLECAARSGVGGKLMRKPGRQSWD
jgi:putative inorganic carbon (HCO3(-)) transporter